jgi:hypothetical protein
MEFLHWLGDIPPISWIVGFFGWMGDWPLVQWIGEQTNTLMWLWDRLPWVLIMTVLLGIALLELLWWGVVVWRAKEAGYDPHKCKNDPRTGKPRTKPVELDKALYRRHSWPRLGLPLFVTAAVMFTIQLVWYHHSTYVVLAVLWFLTAPLRQLRAIAVARRVFQSTHANEKLDSTLWEDFRGYYGAGLSLANPHRTLREEPEPPFFGESWPYRAANAVWRYSRKLGKFWQVWRIFGFLRFWRALGLFITSWAWPITAVIAPFYYMEKVDDYQWWHRPWWRAYRHSDYDSRIVVVEGEAITAAR